MPASRLTAKARRAKGRTFEQETLALFASYGWSVTQLQRNRSDTADALLVAPTGARFTHESKRQERLRIPEWLETLAGALIPGTRPALTFRQSRGQSWTILPTVALLELVAISTPVESGKA